MSILSIAQLRQLTKAGPFVGPHGGKWADAKHTIPYKAGKVKPGSAEHTKALVRHLEEHHGVRMHVGHGDRLSLSKIVVPKDKRGQGTGGKVMGALHRYADAHGKTVTLTPSTDFGGTKSGLKRFYKKHGYVENKGRRKDYEISDSMYREPVKKSLTKAGPYIGPRGGKWADPKHTIPWKPEHAAAPRASRMEIEATPSAEAFVEGVFPGKTLHDVAAASGLDIGEPVRVKMDLSEGRLSVVARFAAAGPDPEAAGWEVTARGGYVLRHEGGGQIRISQHGEVIGVATLEDGEFLEDVQGDIPATKIADFEDRLHRKFAASIDDNVKRYFHRNGTVKNETVQLPPAMQGKGWGTRILHAQVQGASALGVKELRTLAYGKAGTEYSGYYVWPLLGYNAPLTEHRAALSAAGFDPAPYDLHELFKSPKGREWWKANGHSIHASFDLSEGSPGRTVLRQYMEAKGLAKAEEAPEVDEELLCRLWDAFRGLRKGRKIHYRTKFQGLPISIENRRGSHRHWTDHESGEKGSTKMRIPYGYIRGFIGKDGDEIDVFVGPDKASERVFIVNQRAAVDLRKFDEHKVLLGFASVSAAKSAYLKHYDKRGKSFMGSIRQWTMDRFKRWLDRGNLKQPAAKSAWEDELRKAGPYVGPKGGLWADAKHTISWREHIGRKGPRTGAIRVNETRVRQTVDRLVDRMKKLVVEGKEVTYASPNQKQPGTIPFVIENDDGSIKRTVHTYVQVRRPAVANPAVNRYPAAEGGFGPTPSGHWAARLTIPAGRYDTEALKRKLRHVLSHEIAHASDKTVDALWGSEKRAAQPRPSSDYKAYRNLKHEVTASIREVHRELVDAEAVEAVRGDRGWMTPYQWAMTYSKTFRDADNDGIYTKKNMRRVLRSIADTHESVLAGTTKTIRKSAFYVPLSKALFIGPRGGKWADAKHTIAWRDDHHTEVTESGTHFATGKSVVAKVTHRKQKTAHFGAQYGQDIEPHGRYVVHGHLGKPGKTVEPGGHKVETIHDTVHFKNPLVIHHKGTGSGPGEWKRRLSDEHGGKKGKALSRSLAKKGHDAIVTVDKYGTSEIVDLTSFRKALSKAGPFIGPRGGRWADAKHTIPFEKPRTKALFHSAPAHAMESIQEHGLTPRQGSGLFEHGTYGSHSQGKAFLSDNHEAAKTWHGKVEDMLQTRDEDEGWQHDAVMLRVKHRRTSRDEIGDDDVAGSRVTKKAVPPEHIEYHDKEHGWRPLHAWGDGRHSSPGWGGEHELSEEDAHHPGREAHRIVEKRKSAAQAEARRKEAASAELDEAQRKTREKALALRAEWDHKSDAERQEKAKNFRSPIPGYLPTEWKLALRHGPGGVPLSATALRRLESAYGLTKSGVLGTLSIGDLKLIKAQLRKGHQHPSGSGWRLMPKSKKGGWKKVVGTKTVATWYPGQVLTHEHHDKPKPKRKYPWGAAPWTEAQFEVGDFDKDPAHWQWYHQLGRAPIGGKEGGTQFDSHHPVKYGGKPGVLYQIVGAGAEPGWHRLRDVETGAERDVAEDRVFPVFHSLRKRSGRKAVPPVVRRKPKKGARTAPRGPQKPPSDWDPTQPLPEPPGATGPSASAERIPRFTESGAEPGTAVHKMENGYFVRHTRIEYERDEGDVEQRREVKRNAVDNHTKTQLLAEFEGMIVNIAKDVKKRFRLKSVMVEEPGQKSRDTTLEDLRMSAMEGLLVATERYPGGQSFAGYAQLYAREYARIFGAKTMSDVGSLPKRVTRLIPKYLAAKAEAAHELGIDDPTPAQVVHFWVVRKRDLHQLDKDDPQRNEPLPLRTYKLAHKERETTEEGKRKKTTKAKDVREHAGRQEWAERIHNFLTGQATAQGSDFFEGGREVFPGVHIGVGLSEREKIEIRASVTKALEGLDEHEITVSTGRQSSTYRGDTKDMIMRELGLTATGEKESRKEMAAAISIEKKTAKGWRPLGQRQKETMIAEFLKRGFAVAKKRMGGELGEGFVTRAAAVAVPAPLAKRGPTWNQRVKAHARKVSTDAVRAWRKKERDRLRRAMDRMRAGAERMPHGPEREHRFDLAKGIEGALRRIGRVSNREIRLKIAQHELTTGPLGEEMRKLMTRAVAVDPHTPGGVERGRATVTLTDPRTGAQRKVTVATVRDLRPESRVGPWLAKAERTDTVTTGLLWDMMHRPRLTSLLMAEDSVPSLDRAKVEALVGLH